MTVKSVTVLSVTVLSDPSRICNWSSDIIRREEAFYTWLILPKRVADEVLRRCGAIPAALVAFSVCCSSRRRVDAFDNQ